MIKVITITAVAVTLFLAAGCRSTSSTATTKSSSTFTVSHFQPIQQNTGAPLLDDSTFDSEIINSRGVAVVDFFARWCGPCKRMLPVVDSLALEIADAKISKLDVDAAEETASRFDVHAMPCFVIFKDGKEVDRHYGLHTRDEICDWIDTYSGKSVSGTGTTR